MKFSALCLPAVLLCAALSSCTPPPPTIPPGPQDPGARNGESIVSADQKAVEEKRKEVQRKRREAEKKAAAERKKREQQVGDIDTPAPPKPEEKKPTTNWPFGIPVPGNEGFVYSPYNNKLIDVRTMASGTLVKDPDDPADSRNFFRVP